MKLPRLNGRLLGLIAAALMCSVGVFARSTAYAAYAPVNNTNNCPIFTEHPDWLSHVKTAIPDFNVDVDSWYAGQKNGYIFIHRWTADFRSPFNGVAIDDGGATVMEFTQPGNDPDANKWYQVDYASSTVQYSQSAYNPVRTPTGTSCINYAHNVTYASGTPDSSKPQEGVPPKTCDTGKVGNYPDCFDPCPENYTGTPPNCVAPATPPTPGGTGSTGGSTTDDLTPRDIKLIGWSITLALSFIIIRSFRWRSYE